MLKSMSTLYSPSPRERLCCGLPLVSRTALVSPLLVPSSFLIKRISTLAAHSSAGQVKRDHVFSPLNVELSPLLVNVNVMVDLGQSEGRRVKTGPGDASGID